MSNRLLLLMLTRVGVCPAGHFTSQASVHRYQRRCFHLFAGPGTAHVGQMKLYLLFFSHLIDRFGMITTI
jgi:hypothetical protein